ncbi:fasciclin domain-containing protein [Nocardia elegans]|uniref:Fasciclin domain-containing protein n=1 Tax=Nocardia elegans TaxID=300029 RepID=A0ABW6TG33_9NOCA|nr:MULTISPECIES: fasciclin domain-containing protein [Nocardia]MBF6143766.1 fasciclin domain-containing protein [Nocardia nova]MBF6449960.1 fasciclin domain-containing protein [Nocardia elegans]MDN2498060.1 fasciclin domain-containing protein [Nocardia nova]
MRTMKRTVVTAAIVSTAAVLGVSACSSDNNSGSGSSSTTMSSSAMAGSTTTANAMAGLVGPGCKAYAEQVPTGPGSVEGMAQDPVATAASHNPMLTTLTAAVSGKLNPQVNLVDTLNGGQFTVFAPTDDAFAKLPPATVDSLKTDSATLTKILTYHVVPGQIAPDAIAGEHKTVEGGMVNVTRSGDTIKVNDASVVCGGVKTANATVYLIDTVLMPPA